MTIIEDNIVKECGIFTPGNIVQLISDPMLIILITDGVTLNKNCFCGVVLRDVKGNNRDYQHSRDWSKDSFQQFKGKIIIE